MNAKLGLGAVLLFVGLTQACAAPAEEHEAATSTAEIREISTDEALADLATLGESLRLEYGPLEYKHERFGFDLDAELAAARTKILAAKSEGDRVRPFYELLAKLRDGHVSLSVRVRGDASAESSLPFSVTPVDGEYYVQFAPPGGTTTMRAGDKLVSIDGISTKRMEELLLPITEIGTRASTLHKVGAHMTQRPFYVPNELAPREDAEIVVEHAEGTRETVHLTWAKRHGVTGQVIIAPAMPTGPAASTPTAFSPHVAHLVSIFERGQSNPWFLTAQTREALGVVDVAPKSETLAGLGVTGAGSPMRFPLRAFKYRAHDKNVLLVRIPTFMVPMQNFDENVAWLASVLSDNVADSDVCVLDVTHNPGGSVPFVQGIASLFATKPIAGFVQATRASRSQVAMLLQQASMSSGEVQQVYLKRLELMETAFDRDEPLAPFAPMAGRFLGPTFPFAGMEIPGVEMLAPHPATQWNKPVLVLHDELSGSGGDALPMLLQQSGIETFGATTAGMGGSVSGITLPNTGAQLSFTRGLFAAHNPDPTRVQLIENNGVTPNHPHTVTAADFRAGYVGYARAFTEIATSL